MQFRFYFIINVDCQNFYHWFHLDFKYLFFLIRKNLDPLHLSSLLKLMLAYNSFQSVIILMIIFKLICLQKICFEDYTFLSRLLVNYSKLVVVSSYYFIFTIGVNTNELWKYFYFFKVNSLSWSSLNLHNFLGWYWFNHLREYCLIVNY